MGIITPIVEDYRLKKRLKQVGCFDGNRSKTLEIGFDVKLPIAGQPYYFKPDTSLDGVNVVITQIAFVVSTEQSKVSSINGTYTLDNLPSTTLKNGYLVIVDKQQRVTNIIPLFSMINAVNGGKPCFTFLEDYVWENCYVLFETITGITATNGIVVRVTYLERVLKVN